jgi:L-rhamnose isomerase
MNNKPKSRAKANDLIESADLLISQINALIGGTKNISKNVTSHNVSLNEANIKSLKEKTDEMTARLTILDETYKTLINRVENLAANNKIQTRFGYTKPKVYTS